MQDARGSVCLIGHLSTVHGGAWRVREKHKVYYWGGIIVRPKLVTLGVQPVIMKQGGTPARSYLFGSPRRRSTLDQGQDGGCWLR